MEGTGAGAAYVLERNLGGLNQWGERKKLTPGDSRVGDFFGLAVEIDGDTAVVVGDGTAYVFERHLGGVDNWGQRKKLRARDSSADNGLFGSVALSGNRILLGARLNDDAGDNSGAAYVFARNRGGPNNWGEVRKLVPADAASGDQFGLSVALFGDRAVVGAQLNDDPDTSTGSGYVFARNRGGVDQWGQRAKLAGRDTAGFDLFGWSVALSGQTAVVGSIRNDAACSPFDPVTPAPPTSST